MNIIGPVPYHRVKPQSDNYEFNPGNQTSVGRDNCNTGISSFLIFMFQN
jgi:hypothetical protein